MKLIPQQCLIIGPSWVGDMVMAQSLLKLLKQQYPDMAIDVLAPSWSEPLLARMPEVRASICMPVGHGKLELRLRYQIGKNCRQKKYDWAILLPNSLKSALIPFWAKIPKRTGFKGEMRYGLLNDLRHLDKQKLTMTVQRFMALGLPIDAELPTPIIPPALQLSAETIQRTLQQFGLNLDQPVLALCPGAEYGPAKCWPSDHYALVAQEKIKQGWQVWLFGSEKDQKISTEINAKTTGSCVDLAGKTTLEEAIDLLSLATAVISNDSGLMHVAAALNRPLIALYGSSDPGFTPPLNDQSVIEYLNLECSPCFQRECPLQHLNCLNEITPKKVLTSLDRFA